jgi:hypothetical protein
VSDGPSGPTNDPTPSFAFSAGEAVNFKCAFDGLAPSACSGPGNSHTPSLGLSEGAHTFRVLGTDPAGNSGEATRSFIVDTVGPQTTIHGPPATSTSNEAQLTFSSNEPASYECKLDQVDFTPCTSPKTYSGLQAGSHTFQLRATDAFGNISTSDPYTWAVVTTPVSGGGGSTNPASVVGDVPSAAKKCKPKKRKGKKPKKCGSKKRR